MPPDGPAKRILLVDCDAFFVQVARLQDPEGAGRAELLLVGGSPKGRGVVTSASYEARKFGVRSAMPTAEALRLCPGATVVGVPRSACIRKSHEIKELLKGLAPVVQAASIDEFYLDLTGTDRLFRESLEATATRIRERVLEETGVSVSIGGSTSARWSPSSRQDSPSPAVYTSYRKARKPRSCGSSISPTSRASVPRSWSP